MLRMPDGIKNTILLLTRLRGMHPQSEEGALRHEAADEIERLQSALQRVVYEVTHLSPEGDDGSHWCCITRGALAAARAALET